MFTDESDPQGSGLPEAVTDRIGALLFVASQSAQELANARLAAETLNVRQFGVLNLLSAGALSQREISRRLKIDTSAMVGIVDALEARSFVQRVRSSSDRRANEIHLTAVGRRTLERGRVALGGAADEFLAPLEPDERDRLRDYLLRLVERARSDASAGSGAGR